MAKSPTRWQKVRQLIEVLTERFAYFRYFRKRLLAILEGVRSDFKLYVVAALVLILASFLAEESIDLSGTMDSLVTDPLAAIVFLTLLLLAWNFLAAPYRMYREQEKKLIAAQNEVRRLSGSPLDLKAFAEKFSGFVTKSDAAMPNTSLALMVNGFDMRKEDKAAAKQRYYEAEADAKSKMCIEYHDSFRNDVLSILKENGGNSELLAKASDPRSLSDIFDIDTAIKVVAYGYDPSDQLTVGPPIGRDSDAA